MLSGACSSKMFLRCSLSKAPCYRLQFKQAKPIVFRNYGTIPTAKPRKMFWKAQTKELTEIEPWRLAAGGLAVAGIASTCLYGLLSSRKTGVHESLLGHSLVWPDYVANRVHSTYGYMLGTVGMVGASAVTLLRSNGFVRVITRGGMAAPIAMLLTTIGAQIACSQIKYPGDGSKLNAKHITWVLFSGALGALLTPVILLAGEQAVLLRACAYTGALVSSLSSVAYVAPSEKFLSWAGPLSIGFGGLLVASLGSVFVSPATRLGLGLHSICLYGGLALFSAFLLHDTQAVVKRAESHAPPEYSLVPFDPIKNSMGLTLDIFNIFVRLVAILSGRNRKK